ncbi:hypothetical protein [Magnetovibrio blakemorei]|nr:hypothetical protein [Magnetovibrio blakemorei]
MTKATERDWLFPLPKHPEYLARLLAGKLTPDEIDEANKWFPMEMAFGPVNELPEINISRCIFDLDRPHAPPPMPSPDDLIIDELPSKYRGRKSPETLAAEKTLRTTRNREKVDPKAPNWEILAP